MKKTFTTLSCALVMSAFALTANAQNEITLEVPFTISATNNTWQYVNNTGGQIQGYYFISNSKVDLVSEGNLQLWFGDMFAMGDLVAETNNAGNYVYLPPSGWENLGEGNTYNLKYSGSSSAELTMYTGQYVDESHPAAPEPITISLDAPFKLGPTAESLSGQYVYTPQEETSNSMDVYLLTSSTTNLLEEGSEQLVVKGNNYPVTENWTAVADTKTGYYAYNGSVNPEVTYLFEYSGSTDMEFTLKEGVYSIYGEPEYMTEDAVIDYPLTGSKALELPYLVLVWPEGATLAKNTLSAKVGLYIDDDDQPQFVDWYLVNTANIPDLGDEDNPYTDDDPDAEYNALMIYLPTQANENGVPTPGLYTFSIQAGMLANPETGLLNPAQSVSVTVMPGVDGKADVEPGDYDDALDAINVTFEGVSMVENNEANVSCTVNGNTAAVSLDGTTVTFSLQGMPAGEYELVIPGGLYVIDGENLNNEWVGVYTVEEADLATGVISPMAGSKFEEGEAVVVTLTFEGDEILQGNVAVPVEVYLPNKDEAVEYTWSNTTVLSLDDENMQLILNLGDALEVGDYAVVINQGAVLVDGLANYAAETSFQVVEPEKDGVTSLKAELEKGNVYNLQGMKVNANNLKAGVYIVNGKKVLVK